MATSITKTIYSLGTALIALGTIGLLCKLKNLDSRRRRAKEAEYLLDLHEEMDQHTVELLVDHPQVEALRNRRGVQGANLDPWAPQERDLIPWGDALPVQAPGEFPEDPVRRVVDPDEAEEELGEDMWRLSRVKFVVRDYMRIDPRLTPIAINHCICRVKNRHGTMVRNEANLRIARRDVNTFLTGLGVCDQHIARISPIVLELCFIENTTEIEVRRTVHDLHSIRWWGRWRRRLQGYLGLA